VIQNSGRVMQRQKDFSTSSCPDRFYCPYILLSTGISGRIPQPPTPPNKGARTLSPKLISIYCQDKNAHSCTLSPSHFIISECLIKHKDSHSVHTSLPNNSRFLQTTYLAESLQLLSELQTDTSDKAHYHIYGIE